MPTTEIRLNRYLAQSGLGSRRACDELIAKGLVTVNGKVVTSLGSRVHPIQDQVHVHGRLIRIESNFVYYLLNKASQVVTTARDPYGRTTVLDGLPAEPRIFPVGRLDYDTTGALLLTNDGDLAYQLTHPSFQVPKLYQVRVKGRVRDEDLKRLESGIELEDGKPAKGEVITFNYSSTHTDVQLRLREGRKREIKRMFLQLGHKVVRLHREMFANLTVTNLKPGEYRRLSAAEVFELKELVHGYSG